MNRAQIQARMAAIVVAAQALLPDLNASSNTKVREARAKHAGLMDEFDGLERSLKAAGAVDTERGDPEFGGLVTRSSLGELMGAVIDGREVEGATRELQTERGLAANVVPLDMIEQRAVTPAPGNVGTSEAAVVQPVFATGDANFLSVAQPRVPAGEAIYPVLTSRPTVGGPHTDSTSVGETTGSFTAEVLSPARLQASFFWKRVDAAKFAGMDAALRAALSSSLSEAYDKEVIDQLVADVARTDAAAETTFALYRSGLVYARLDGRFASVEGDIRLLMGSGTAAHAAGKYRSNSADDSALDSLRRISGGVRVSAHVAAVAANKQQDCLVRRGARQDFVAPIWQGITLVPDAITKADTGEVKLTALMLAAFKTVRTDGFARIQTQHA